MPGPGLDLVAEEESARLTGVSRRSRAQELLIAALRRFAALPLILAVGLSLAGCVSITRVGDQATRQSAGSPSTSAPGNGPGSSGGSSGPVASSGEGSGSPRPPRIGYLSLDERNAFVASVSASIRAALEAAGLDLVACDPGWTREGVTDCARRLGEAGIDGLLSFQPFLDLAEPVCTAVGDVPVVGVVFDQGSCQVSRLRIDQAESGRLAGDAVGRFAADRWDCEASAYLSLESSDADPDGRARMEGYRAGYEEHCPLPGRTFVLDDADRLVTAQTQVASRLEGLQGKRIIVVGLNDDAILGAMAAASAAGRADEVWYSGQLATPSIRERIACDGHYIASVAQFPERFGEQVVPLIVGALDGTAVPPVVDATLELVTASNVRQLFPDTPACHG
jgi:ribose transport system substrate-binding protein